ncbi:MAG: metal ABC transporter substrate-binding protein [bacterium]
MWQRGLIFFISLVTAMLFSGCGSGGNKVVVVTTISVVADWVKEVAGDRILVKSLLKGYEEPHGYEPNPGDAQLIAQAQLVVRVGLGLDEWLDGLIANAGNPKLRIITLADGVEVIQEEVTGGVHEAGNPHIWLDPDVAKMGAMRIAQALMEIDPDNKRFYLQGAEGYIRQLDSVQAVLKDMVTDLRDRRFVALHNSWPYFCRAFGFEMVAAIEPLPGQEPSARDLARLVSMMRQDSVRVVVVEPQHNRDEAEALARETGAKVVVLSSVTGGLPETGTYLKLLEYNVGMLVKELAIDNH